MPWFVQAIETTICLPNREISTLYEGSKILIRPATAEFYADVSIEFESGNDLASRKTVSRFLSALSWVYRHAIYIRVASGGTIRGRIRKNHIDHAFGEIDLNNLPEISNNEKQALALSLYRNALCANSITTTCVELTRILEIKLGKGSSKIKAWFNKHITTIKDEDWQEMLPHDLEAKRRLNELIKGNLRQDIGDYLYQTIRNASAHAGRWPINDPNDPQTIEKLCQDLCLVWYLVEKFIEIELGIESAYRKRPILPSMYTCMKLSGMLDCKNEE